MFGRRQKPLLVMHFSSGDYPGDDPEIREVKFSFINEGRWTAQHYGFLCRFDNNIELLGNLGVGITNVSELNGGEPTISYDNNVNIIHPNGITYNIGGMCYKRKDKTRKIFGRITYYCQGMLARNIAIMLE